MRAHAATSAFQGVCQLPLVYDLTYVSVYEQPSGGSIRFYHLLSVWSYQWSDGHGHIYPHVQGFRPTRTIISMFVLHDFETSSMTKKAWVGAR